MIFSSTVSSAIINALPLRGLILSLGLVPAPGSKELTFAPADDEIKVIAKVSKQLPPELSQENTLSQEEIVNTNPVLSWLSERTQSSQKPYLQASTFPCGLTQHKQHAVTIFSQLSPDPLSRARWQLDGLVSARPAPSFTWRPRF
ncbi:hypothetical protein JX266_013774 [Neoarthrinium moseri]|nr:hypothetical protein JX266_013774 [Neoarthrinium moseri]